MSAGDPSNWDDFFQQNLVPAVLSLIVETWEKTAKPQDTDLEDAISVRLYAAMVNAKDRSRHPFLIRYQDVEVDIDLAKETGRKDIVVYPSTMESVYFCLEAKRLNALVSGVRKSLADEYVKEGMQRFVERKYAPMVRHGAMLAYVLDGKIAKAIANVANNITARALLLGMDHDASFQPSTVRPEDPSAKETRHRRVGEKDLFRIHHLFVVGNATKESTGPKTKTPPPNKTGLG